MNDNAQVDFGAGCDPACSTQNDSFTQGNGVVSSPGVNGATLTAPGESYMFGGFNESGTYKISTNTIYQVELVTNVSVSGGTGTAYIDPVITVPEGYTLELSPGVGDGHRGPANVDRPKR